MPAVRLERRLVPKVWGRRDVPAVFGALPRKGEKLGEIWFVDPRGEEAELLVKYLFTSERLSIQVHPDDAAARAAGHRRGKDEAWLVLKAEPGAAIGIGLREAVSRETLRTAAMDGRIEDLLDWRPVKAGDVFYSPAGTVHALGPGLMLVEVQQNLDLTYRLYDYGRPRALHLEEGIEAADPAPYDLVCASREVEPGRTLLASGAAFVLERWSGREAEIDGDAAPIWLIPLLGQAALDGQILEPGSVWVANGRSALDVGAGAELLLAYPGAELRWRAPA